MVSTHIHVNTVTDQQKAILRVSGNKGHATNANDVLPQFVWYYMLEFRPSAGNVAS